MINVAKKFYLLELIHDHLQFRIDATPIYGARHSEGTPFISIYIDIAHRPSRVVALQLRSARHGGVAKV